MYLEKTFNKKDLNYKYSGEKIITHKMKKGDKIGKVDIYYDDEKLTSVNIVLKEKPRLSIIKYLWGHKLIVGLFILIIVLTCFKKKKRIIKIKVKKKRR
jgi:hypothetical protein